MFATPLYPKKYLGQVFLKSSTVIDRIIEACGIKPSDTVLEIGPGPGTLTGELSDRAKEVIAVEADQRFCKELGKRFTSAHVRIIHEDILKFSFETLPQPAVVVGNLPYYISSPIIEKIIDNRNYVDRAYLMVQLEFGKRMIAPVGTRDYSSLSLFTQYFTDTKLLFKINRNSFKPIPKVDSCLMKLQMRTKTLASGIDETLLFRIIRTAFQHRRKTISNALSYVFDNISIDQAFQRTVLDPCLRPENLSLENYCELTHAFSNSDHNQQNI